jgi:hypothetical protein
MDNATIARIAVQAVRRELPGFITTPGWCTAFVFEVIARAYNTNRWVLYSKILDSVNADLDKSRWAKDVELAVSRLGWVRQRTDYDPNKPAEREKLLAILKPGDLVFSSTTFDEAPKSPRTAPDVEGHIGIYVGLYQGMHYVAENTRADRGLWYGRRNALRLTQLARWDTVTSIARIPENWRP